MSCVFAFASTFPSLLNNNGSIHRSTAAPATQTPSQSSYLTNARQQAYHVLSCKLERRSRSTLPFTFLAPGQWALRCSNPFPFPHHVISTIHARPSPSPSPIAAPALPPAPQNSPKRSRSHARQRKLYRYVGSSLARDVSASACFTKQSTVRVWWRVCCLRSAGVMARFETWNISVELGAGVKRATCAP